MVCKNGGNFVKMEEIFCNHNSKARPFCWSNCFTGLCLFIDMGNPVSIYRFGKPCVIDMMEVDMWHAVERRFDEVTEGLLASMMDKSIMQEEK